MKRDLGFRYIANLPALTRILVMNLAYKISQGNAGYEEIFNLVKLLDSESLAPALSFLQLHLENLLVDSLEDN